VRDTKKKRNVQSQHKFCLTIENLFPQEDWVTEKVYHSLASGCVPVFWGATNIEDYMPCDNCIIHGNRFKSIKDLANYLIFLDNHPYEYEKYLEYKRKPLVLKPMLQASKRFGWCAACYMMSLMKKGELKPDKLVWSMADKKWVKLQTWM